MVESWWTPFILSNIKVIKEIHGSFCPGCFICCSWHRWFCKEIGFMKVQQHSLCCETKPGESPCALLCIKAGRIMRKDFTSLSVTAETFQVLSMLPVPVMCRGGLWTPGDASPRGDEWREVYLWRHGTLFLLWRPPAHGRLIAQLSAERSLEWPAAALLR